MTKYVDPTRDQFRAMAEAPESGPIWMLNMIRLRKNAKYEDKREASGAEAYAAYARESEPFFKGVGGRIVWSATPELMLIGPDDERWDMVFAAEYPSSEAFVNMVKNPGYQAIVFHRQAAFKTSRRIRMKPGVAGKVFS
ncbi:MAG: DUF1330 domain-containing protein [Parvularculaceae bacterium]|nr:DUF1330 domain-containing protein [Parvularculaceae bacterium]